MFLRLSRKSQVAVFGGEITFGAPGQPSAGDIKKSSIELNRVAAAHSERQQHAGKGLTVEGERNASGAEG
jgi:hypothetical protein